MKICSEPGHGTTVKLYVPRLVAGAPTVESASVRTPGQSLGETIDPGVEVIQKPVTQADLASRIRTVLDEPRLSQKNK